MNILINQILSCTWIPLLFIQISNWSVDVSYDYRTNYLSLGFLLIGFSTYQSLKSCAL